MFRRQKPLHEQLAERGGLSLETDGVMRPTQAAAPPGWDGEASGEAGIHGVARTRRWDSVTIVEAPGLRGDEVRFVALPDGTLVVDEDEPDGALTPLADAVETAVAPPYRAEAVRRGPARWAVAAVRIAVAEARGLDGDRAELVVSADAATLTVDGRSSTAHVPAFELAGEAHGRTYVVRAERLDGDLWEIEALPL